jgi:hypothetical protein
MTLKSALRRGLASLSQVDPVKTSLTPVLRPAKERFISPGDFNSLYLEQGRPGYFPGLVSHPDSPFQWPACRKWPLSSTIQQGGNLDGLRTIQHLQSLSVDVEISPKGRGYGDGVKRSGHSSSGKGGRGEQGQVDDSDWMKVTMPFETFMDTFIDGKVKWNEKRVQMVGYLAQQNLFEQIPELAVDCPTLPHTSAGTRGNREQWRRNVWIGGSGSFTPIHCDPYENLFVQVVGTKRAHLFPPQVAQHLHLFPSSTRQSNTSAIPTEDILLSETSKASLQSEYPGIQSALSHPDTRHVTLEAGDALYIPRNWYHCLQSTSISASVNAWFR